MKIEQSIHMKALADVDGGAFCMIRFHGEIHLGIKTIIDGPAIQTRFSVLSHPKESVQPRLIRLDTSERVLHLPNAWLEFSFDPASIIFGLKHTPGYICKCGDDAFLLVQVDSDDTCFVDLKTGGYQIYAPQGEKVCFTRWKVLLPRSDREPEVVYSFR